MSERRSMASPRGHSTYELAAFTPINTVGTYTVLTDLHAHTRFSSLGLHICHIVYDWTMWSCYPNFMPASELRISGGRNVENASASSIDTPKYATGQDGLFPYQLSSPLDP